MGLKSKTLFKPLGSALPFSQVNSHVARLAVLYEDLRIEYSGIIEEKILCLDQIGDKYRRHYFVRRSILTLVEMAETFRLLNQDSDFQEIKNTFDRRSCIQWRRTVSFFAGHERFLKDVRNDIGGHFGHPAAISSLKDIPYSTVGKMEVEHASNGLLNVKLLFAGEIAAAAFSRQRNNKPPLEFAKYLIRLTKRGYRLSTQAVQIISYNYLWKRFGG